MKKIIYIFALLLVLSSFGCGEKNIKPTGDGTLLFKSHEKTPRWIYSVPDEDNGKLFFVGISGKAASEKVSREDAYNNTTLGVVKYLGTSIKDQIKKVSLTYGKSSKILDPTEAGKRISEQTAKGVSRRLKAKEYYVERWGKDGVTYYITRVLCRVSKRSLNEAFKTAIKKEVEKVKQKKKDAATDEARKQADNALNLLNQVSKQGLPAEE